MAQFLKFFEMKPPSMETVDRLWKGSIDMHLHIAPDPTVPRRVDGIQAAETAQAGGMRAMVLKSAFYATTPVALAANRVVPEVTCIGSLNIEYGTTGGLCDEAVIAVENNAKIGCKVLWMPTFDAAYARSYIPGREGTGISLFGADGKPDPAAMEIVERILKVVKQYNMVLCSGHLSYEETVVLFEAARKIGIEKMVATHPMSDVIWPAMTMDQMKHLVSLGAYIEHVYRNCLPLLGSLDPQDYVDAIHEIGAEHTILGTDFAQVADTTPAEGYRTFIAYMLQYGVDEKDVERMVKINPAKLLDLDNEN